MLFMLALMVTPDSARSFVVTITMKQKQCWMIFCVELVDLGVLVECGQTKEVKTLKLEFLCAEREDWIEVVSSWVYPYITKELKDFGVI